MCGCNGRCGGCGGCGRRRVGGGVPVATWVAAQGTLSPSGRLSGPLTVDLEEEVLPWWETILAGGLVAGGALALVLAFRR